MYAFKCFIVAVLIAVSEAKGGDLKGTISDDLDQKPADLLTSLASEIAKSDVDITLHGVRVPEDATTDATDSDGVNRQDKTPENVSQLKSDQELASISSAEGEQKITHTSDDNASFIHVKEKIARQGSDEEGIEDDEEQRDGNDDFNERNEPKQVSDDLKSDEESHKVPVEIAETKSVDEEEMEDAEQSDSVEADDTQDLFKSDTAEVDVNSTPQSRRMLSFDKNFLEAISTPKVETELLLEARSGLHNYEQRDHHHRANDNRRDYPSLAKPLPFSSLNTPILPPPSLFHPPGQPQHPHFQPSGNIENHPYPLDKSLLNPGLFRQNEPHFEENHNHHVNHHLRTVQQLFPHPLEQPLQSFQQFHLPQTLQREIPLQFSQPLPMFQPSQSSHSWNTLESWHPLQSFQSMHSPKLSSLAPSSRSASSFQPPQMKMDNMLSRLQEATQNSVNSDLANQFSEVLNKNWNVGYNSFSKV